MKRALHIFKGTSSSGKTTLAEYVSHPKVVITADDYFYDSDGNYNFDATKLGAAHAACRDEFDRYVNDETILNIVICNTNTRESEWKYYSDKAIEAGMLVFHIVIEKRHDNENSHSVPQHTLERQANSIKQNLKLL